MRVDGTCHCGKLRFGADIDPDRIFICHCTDCQQMSGSAFRMAVRTPAEKFELLAGQPATYVRIAESGRRRGQVFCSDCGTHIYATSADADGAPKLHGVRVSLLRQRYELPPRRQYWTRSAQDWLHEIDDLPGFALQMPAPVTNDAAPRRTVEGGCHCGHVRFRAAIEEGNVTLCHCADCQAMASSAFRLSAYANDFDVAMLGAAPALYVKTAENGNRRVQAFCPRCGTQLYATSDGSGPKTINLRVGTLRERNALPPVRQIWMRSRLPWVGNIAALEAHETQ